LRFISRRLLPFYQHVEMAAETTNHQATGATDQELAAARAELARVTAHDATLAAQLAAVGAELAETRGVLAAKTTAYEQLESRLRAVESGTDGTESLLAANARAYRERSALILLPRLLEMLPPGDTVVVVDAGAREVDRDPRWRPFPRERLRFYGFEPDAAETRRLNDAGADSRFPTEFFAAGLWSFTGRLTFRHNNASGGSSYLRQNRAVTDRWKFENPTQVSMAHEIFREVGTEEIDTISLQDWATRAHVAEVDFLKLNVQGAELEILRGAGPLLGGVLGVLVEVAFVESYDSRPMFSDIDVALREAGFTFFDLLAHHYVGRADSPIAAQHLTLVEPRLGLLTSAWGQLVEGHALYLRDPVADGTTPSGDRILKLAILAETYGQIEFAFELLEHLARRGDVVGTPADQRIRQVLEAGSAEYWSHLRPDVPRDPVVPVAHDGRDA